ncbi:Spindle-related protein [Penicillium capsulatum]|uniref:Spindle assembly checkpoint component MAD1 n=1 Tax=Penicillium capsulatum TaxID=69766 RepID=A0A9W9LKE7_9EURO|nr:Spindle-related protein [Penicillium capsulatum]KAJ6116898.1 Spindle-related protein [Penicillium capsulatum]
MDNSHNSRPASQLIAGFATPSTPAGARSSLRQSTRSAHSVAPPLQPLQPLHDAEKQELRVQLSALRYELENAKQEKEVETLRHEKELRDLQLKADADFRKTQAAESASHRATHKSETLSKELKEAQDQAFNEKMALERKVRNLLEEKQNIEEEYNETQAQLSDQERQFKYQINELETVRASLQKTVEDLQNDLQAARSSQEFTQEKLAHQEAAVAELEAENIRLKSEGNDAEALAVLKRELSDQVNHIRVLETTNRENSSELQRLRKVAKNVDVVEEQKRTLENQLHMMSGLESEIGTLRYQKQALEDERSSWASLLQENDQPEGQFSGSPEEVVKALVQEQIQNATLVDQLGQIQAESLGKDEAIQSLEQEKSQLRQELEKARSSEATQGAPDVRARARLERQRALAVKEVEYLRAQLKTFDEEETTMNAEQSQFDKRKSDQIAELEKLVDNYRTELEKAHEELSKREAPPPEPSQPRGIKRPLSPAESDAESERVAVLSRKYRKEQAARVKSEQALDLARKELKAAKSQIKSRTRVLELRDNPTAEVEKIKMTTLRTLRSENKDLLAQLRGGHSHVKVVPASTLESLKLEMEEMERVQADKDKRMDRLKGVYAAKISEFREAVASILGFKLDILPNHRVRVTSMFHVSAAYRHGDPRAISDAQGPGNGEENSILFDGYNGTMKLSGGNNSEFAQEIKELVNVYVHEKKDIPCFLAAMTLEFFEKAARANQMV